MRSLRQPPSLRLFRPLEPQCRPRALQPALRPSGVGLDINIELGHCNSVGLCFLFRLDLGLDLGRPISSASTVHLSLELCSRLGVLHLSDSSVLFSLGLRVRIGDVHHLLRPSTSASSSAATLAAPISPTLPSSLRPRHRPRAQQPARPLSAISLDRPNTFDFRVLFGLTSASTSAALTSSVATVHRGLGLRVRLGDIHPFNLPSSSASTSASSSAPGP